MTLKVSKLPFKKLLELATSNPQKLAMALQSISFSKLIIPFQNFHRVVLCSTDDDGHPSCAIIDENKLCHIFELSSTETLIKQEIRPVSELICIECLVLPCGHLLLVHESGIFQIVDMRTKQILNTFQELSSVKCLRLKHIKNIFEDDETQTEEWYSNNMGYTIAVSVLHPDGSEQEYSYLLARCINHNDSSCARSWKMALIDRFDSDSVDCGTVGQYNSDGSGEFSWKINSQELTVLALHLSTVQDIAAIARGYLLQQQNGGTMTLENICIKSVADLQGFLGGLLTSHVAENVVTEEFFKQVYSSIPFLGLGPMVAIVNAVTFFSLECDNLESILDTCEVSDESTRRDTV